jgi:hypothetical protein
MLQTGQTGGLTWIKSTEFSTAKPQRPVISCVQAAAPAAVATMRQLRHNHSHKNKY